MGKSQHFASELFDHVGIREIGPQKRDIVLKLGAHGLEALNLELQSALALDQFLSSLETVAAFKRVKGEVGR